MDKNICPFCGSPLELANHRLKCRYCGYNKAEDASPEESSLLYVAFQKLRMADFDEASELFSDILRHFPNSSEAYWGATLAEYGIKYEDDYDGRKVPTCYAARYESFLESYTYKQALACASEEQRAYYREQAIMIDATRLAWVQKAEKEPPYDVFLSYKEAEDGKRTPDSEEAYEIFNILTGLGYRVFFSRITLAGKTGENYEPYIFSALNSAPVMLVYASKKEYIESTWVRNEWNRYLARIRNKQKQEGSLCVIFTDSLNPSKLPASLRSKQHLRRTDITFLDNLRTYVEKYVSQARMKTPRIDRKEVKLAKKKGQKSIGAVKLENVASISMRKHGKESFEIQKRQVGSAGVIALTPSEESKLAQAEIYFSHGDSEKAGLLYEDVLSTNSHSQQALIGVLVIRLGYKSLEELLRTPEELLRELDLTIATIDYSEEEAANAILEALSRVCQSRLRTRDFGTVNKVYSRICDYDVPIINRLHEDLFEESLSKLDNDDGVALCKACLPFLSGDYELYRESLAKAIKSLFESRRFEDCLYFGGQYGQHYEFDAKIYEYVLLAKEKCASPRLWLSTLATKGDFSCLSKELPLSETEIECLFAWVANLSLTMIEDAPSEANVVVRFLLAYQFQQRNEFVDKGIKICQKYPNEWTAEVLDSFLRVYGDADYGTFLKAQEDFVHNCFDNGRYELAIKYLNRLIEYDPDSEKWYFLRCCAKMGCAPFELNEKIHLICDYCDVEALIANRDKKPVADVIKPLLDAAVYAKSLKEACPIFDALISYLPKEEDPALLEYLGMMARACLNASLFVEAERYYASIVTMEPNYHAAYFGILMAKLQVHNEEELIHHNVPIGDFVEFDNAKLATGKDRKALEHYIEVELKQTQWAQSEKQRAAAEEEEERRREEARRREEEAERNRRKKQRTRRIIIGAISLSAVAVTLTALGAIVPTVIVPLVNLNHDISLVAQGISLVNIGDYRSATSLLEGMTYGESQNIYRMALAGEAFSAGDYEAGIDFVLRAGGEIGVTYIYKGEGSIEKKVETIRPKGRYINNNPVTPGYEIDEWKLTSFSVKVADHLYVSSISLSANASRPITYSVDYELNGGSLQTETMPVTYTVESDIDLPIPTKEGYDFNGWYDLRTGSSFLRIESGNYGDLSLMARWFPKNYKIFYNLNGGKNDALNPSAYTIEDEVVLAAPTRPGYEFLGWRNDRGEQVFSIAKGTVGDISLIAQWAPVANGLIVLSNDPEKGEVTITKGAGYTDESITVSATPAEDCIFTGWYCEGEMISQEASYTFVMPAADSSLTAYFLDLGEWKASHGFLPVFSDDGKTVVYGLYPQKHVSDPGTIKLLNSLSSSQDNGWYLLAGEYYAKRIANPLLANSTYSDSTPITSGAIDWFLCKPITWNVLSSAAGEVFVVSKTLLDVRRYSEYYPNQKAGVYANNYRASEIRKWLNEEFYSSAFFFDDSYTLTSIVDNSVVTTANGINPYVCDATEDKIFLLSYKDYSNRSYGFSDDISRVCKVTDWALSSGAYSANGNGFYWTRTPHHAYSYTSLYIDSGGSFADSRVGFAENCIRPGLRIRDVR